MNRAKVSEADPLLRLPWRSAHNLVIGRHFDNELRFSASCGQAARLALSRNVRFTPKF